MTVLVQGHLPPRWTSATRRRLRQLNNLQCTVDRELQRLQAPPEVAAEVAAVLAKWRAAAIVSAAQGVEP